MMTHSRFSATALLLLSQMVGIAKAEENCVAIEELGTPSLSQYGASVTMNMNDNDMYTLKVKFQHDVNLPIPDDPVTQCDPARNPPILAPDELPYFASRWSYESLPEDIQAATGIDHISIDFNPCGHPPVAKFGISHYDIHFYRESPDYRRCMTCVTLPGAPVCDFAEDAQVGSQSGQEFFNIDFVEETDQIRNMPEGFVAGMDHMVELMGGHAWNLDQEPTSAIEWIDPVWIMGTYDANILFLEPMVPLVFLQGDSDRLYEEDLTYEAQTMNELPSSIKAEYNRTTGFATFTLKGSKKIDCSDKPKSFKIEIKGKEKKKNCEWLAGVSKKKKRKGYCNTTVKVKGKNKNKPLHKHCKETCGRVGQGDCAFLKGT